MKTQIFRQTPPSETVHSVLNAFGLQSFDDSHTFTKNDLKKIQTVEQIKNMFGDIQSYYYPCKSKQYLSNLTEKNVITILRQFAKLHNIHVVSNEKYIDGKKYIVYHIEKSTSNLLDEHSNIDNKSINSKTNGGLNNVTKKKKNVVLSFN
jgi:hypothetical protein